MMKKVFLYAYDRINLGDDLFVHTITKRYPQVQFYMWTSKENKRTFQSLDNLKIIAHNSVFIKLLERIRPSLIARYRMLMEKKCKAVVYIGGSIFIEYDNWDNILNWWEYEAENRPFYVLGANFGPYKSEGYRKRLDSIFEKMEDVCFRDSYSYQKFEGNKVIRKTSDILFSYDMPTADFVNKQIFISVIELSSRKQNGNSLYLHDKEYIDKISEIIKGYINQGYSIVLSSFCKHEGDEIAIEKILSQLDAGLKDKIQVLNYDGVNVEQILNAIVESEAVIASRFHAAILGIVAGKTVFPIVYSEKTIHVLEDMNFKGEYADIRKIEELDFDTVEKNLKVVSIYSINKLKESAKLHFEKLDKVLR